MGSRRTASGSAQPTAAKGEPSVPCGDALSHRVRAPTPLTGARVERSAHPEPMSENAEQRRLVPSEQAQIRRWRRAQFLALGFTLKEAQALTKAPVDLGQMRTLIASGCPPETARRIVL